MKNSIKNNSIKNNMKNSIKNNSIKNNMKNSIKNNIKNNMKNSIKNNIKNNKNNNMKIFGMTYKRALIIFVLLIGVYKLLLLAGTYTSGDACHHLAVSRYISENRALPTLVNLVSDCFARPPLFHILSAVLYGIGSIFNQTIATFMMSLTSLIFSSLAIVIVYYIARKFYDENISLLSAVLFGILPIVIELSVQAYVDMTLTALVLLAVYLCINKRYFFTAVVFGFGLLSNLNAVFIFPLLIYICYYNVFNDKMSIDKVSRDNVFNDKMSIDKVSRNKIFRNNLFHDRTTKKNNRMLILKFAKILSFFIISLLIASPQYIHIYQNFGNPVWSYMNQIFHGRTDYAEVLSFNEYSASFSLGWLAKQGAVVYTEVFGLPSGNVDYLANFGNFRYALYMWFIVCIFWLILLMLGLRREIINKRAFLLIWIIPYFLLLVYYLFTITSNVVTHSRYLLPAIPAMCMLISAEIMHVNKRLSGSNSRKIKVSRKNRSSDTLKKIWKFIIFAFLLLFLLTALPKLYFNIKTWQGPVDEVNKIKELAGILPNSNILTNNGCLMYHMRAKTVAFTIDERLINNPGQYYYNITSKTIDESQLNKIDYIFYNKDLSKDSKAVELIEILVSQNRIVSIYVDIATETKVYKVIH